MVRPQGRPDHADELDPAGDDQAAHADTDPIGDEAESDRDDEPADVDPKPEAGPGPADGVDTTEPGALPLSDRLGAVARRVAARLGAAALARLPAVRACLVPPSAAVGGHRRGRVAALHQLPTR